MSQEPLNRLSIDRSIKAGATRGRVRWYVTAVVIVILGAILLYGGGVIPSAVTVETATVSQYYPSQGFTLLNASGYVVAQRKAAVAAKVTGRLVWIGVEEGSRVRKGDVIARLENDDADALRKQAAAALETARANREQSRAELTEATRTFERYRTLFTAGIVSQSDYDAAESRLDRAKGGAAAADSTIRGAAAALAAAEVSYEQTLIRAPFDGVILTKNADVGDIVTPIGAAADAKSAVVTMADLSSLLVETDVSESNLSQIRVGGACEVQLDALPRERFPATVHMIVPTADRTKGTVLVKVRLDRLDTRILPEMSAKVAFLQRPVAPSERDPKTVVPQTVLLDKNGPHIYIPDGDRARLVPVRTGNRDGERVEIISGVKAGDRIIISPLQKLSDGRRIRLAEK